MYTRVIFFPLFEGLGYPKRVDGDRGVMTFKIPTTHTHLDRPLLKPAHSSNQVGDNLINFVGLDNI